MILSVISHLFIYLMLCCQSLHGDEITQEDRDHHHSTCKFIMYFSGYEPPVEKRSQHKKKHAKGTVTHILKTIVVYELLNPRRLSSSIVKYLRTHEDSFITLSLPAIICRNVTTLLTAQKESLPKDYKKWIFPDKRRVFDGNKLRRSLDVFLDDLRDSYNSDESPRENEIQTALKVYRERWKHEADKLTDANDRTEANIIINFFNQMINPEIKPSEEPMTYQKKRQWYYETKMKIEKKTMPRPELPELPELFSIQFSLKFMRRVALWELSVYDIEIRLNQHILNLEKCSERADFVEKISHLKVDIENLKSCWGEHMAKFSENWKICSMEYADNLGQILIQLHVSIKETADLCNPAIDGYNELVEIYSNDIALQRILPDDYFERINKGLFKPKQISKILGSLVGISKKCIDQYNKNSGLSAVGF